MNNRTKRIISIAATVTVTCIGGAFAFHSLHQEEHGAAPKSNYERDNSVSALNPNGSELVVRVFTISRENDGAKEQSFTGTLQPRYVSNVGFRVAGKILERKIELGQNVRKGDLLFRLDPEDLELQLRVTEADSISAKSVLTQANAEEHRLAQLRSSGSISQSDYDLAVATRDVASARVDSAQRRWKLAQNQRAYCDLVADSDGLILSISAEAGQVVSVGQPVLQLMQSDLLEASVNLPEGFAKQAQSSKATVTFWSRKDSCLKAELRELSPVADPVSRTYDARFRLLDRVDDLTIGMTATVTLTEEGIYGLAVPSTSISSRQEKAVVWRIVNQNRVEAVPVEVVQYKSKSAIVVGDLKAGDRIVSAGVQRIDENVTVRIWESK
jgi:membrane fusion protein, multidrug efflux system